MKLHWNTATLHLGIMNWWLQQHCYSTEELYQKGYKMLPYLHTASWHTANRCLHSSIYDVMPAQTATIILPSSYMEFLKLHNSNF